MDTKDIFDLVVQLKALNQIGIALSTEKDSTRLLERILEEAMRITSADGGILYTRTENENLKFEIIIIETLDTYKGGSNGESIICLPLPLYLPDGTPNLHSVAVRAVLTGVTINITDVDKAEFDFSELYQCNSSGNYPFKSFLTVPMRNHEDQIIGVLELINALDPDTGETGTFGSFEQELVESLASQAAIALTNQRLLDEQRRLFEAFIELIARAIDDKSPYTAGHCQRVPVLALMLADAVSQTQVGPLKSFKMTEEDRYELMIAGLLHDCGKITTPEYMIDKSKKLQTIFDRIHLVDTRFEVLKRDIEIRLLRQQLALQAIDLKQLEQQLAAQTEKVDQDRDFLHQCNQGKEYMLETEKQRVREIAETYTWCSPEGQIEPCLLPNEIDNLCITKGTLTAEERDTINYHIVSTINMLEALPYPKHLCHIPEYAGAHHEHIDGSGYPKGLTREQMSIPARIMAIADIFEALTASDRPYKKPMPLSQALTILGKMKLEKHIDPDLFDIFIHEKVYLHYAKKHLSPEQIDTFDLNKILGYHQLLF